MTDWIITPPAPDADPALIAQHQHVQRFPHRALVLFQQKNFLNTEECTALVERIDSKRRPSTIADHNGDDAFRTSETCDLSDDDPAITDLNMRISNYLGIDPAYGEPLQGQRYAVGQEFKAHTDYFEPQGPDFAQYCTKSGNRTWTAMVYLNEPEAGGATRFTNVGKSVHPQTGKMLLWNNRMPDGTPNPYTMHHGMKVRAGTKYVITKWFRERPWG